MLPDWHDDESSALHRLTTADQRDERLGEESRNDRSIRRRIEQSDALMRRYEAVIADRSPSTVHAAFLRSAQGLHDKALQLSHVSWPEPVGSFCSDDRVASLLAEAEPYLGACERIARATGNIDVWAERCIARRSDPAPELHASSTRPIPAASQFSSQNKYPRQLPPGVREHAQHRRAAGGVEAVAVVQLAR